MGFGINLPSSAAQISRSDADGKYGVLSTQNGCVRLHNRILPIVHSSSSTMGRIVATLAVLFFHFGTVSAQDVEGMYASGITHFEQGEHRHAISFFTAVIEYAPKHTAALLHRGMAYGRSEKNDLALNDFNSLLKLDPWNAIAYLERGRVHLALGHTSAACDDWEAASEKGNQDAKNLIESNCKN
jgi:lipoprotein NlpI